MGSHKIWGKFHRALKKEDWAEAISCIDQIIRDEPKNPNHHLKKGDICQKKGDNTEAANSYLKAAWYINKQGFFKKSLAVYKMVLRIDPQNQEAIETSNKILMELEAQQQVKVPAFQPTIVDTEADNQPVQDEEPGAAVIESTSYEQPTEESVSEAERVMTEEAASETSLDNKDTSIFERTSYEPTPGEGEPQTESLIEQTSLSDESKPAVEAEDITSTKFLSPLTDSEMKEILTRSEIKHYSRGETIVHEGDAGDSVFIIKSGRVSVVAHILGREISLATLSAGDFFGEVSYLTGRPRTANVVSEDDVEAYEINRFLLDEIIEKRPEILSQVDEIYNARVKDTLQKIKSK